MILFRVSGEDPPQRMFEVLAPAFASLQTLIVQNFSPAPFDLLLDALAAGAGAHLVDLYFDGGGGDSHEAWSKKLYGLLESEEYICPNLARVDLIRDTQLDNKFKILLDERRNKYYARRS